MAVLRELGTLLVVREDEYQELGPAEHTQLPPTCPLQSLSKNEVLRHREEKRCGCLTVCCCVWKLRSSVVKGHWALRSHQYRWHCDSGVLSYTVAMYHVRTVGESGSHA